MRQSRVGYGAARGVAVAVVVIVAGALVGPSVPAHGQLELLRQEATSDYDTTSHKSVTVDCRGEEVAFGLGAEITDGRGDVMLTRMEPNAGLGSVTVSARARSGHQWPWSITAYVLCDSSLISPVRESGTTHDASSAAVSCGERDVLAAGFRYDGDVETGYVNGLVPNIAQSQVQVFAGGDGPPPATLTAYAICRARAGSNSERLSATAPLGETSSIRVMVGTPERSVYGVGARTTVPGVHFDALMPSQDAGLAGVRAVRVPATTAAARVGPGTQAADGDGDETVTVFGVDNYVFH